MRKLTVAALVLVGACASGPVCPEHGGAPWRLVESTHFQLYSDAAPDEAKRLAGEFEKIFAALNTVLLVSNNPPRGRVRVVDFRRESDFDAFRKNSHIVAFYRDDNDPTQRATVVMHGDLDDESRRTFFHELTHRFLRHFAPNTPVWFNEGLAQVAGTATIDERGFTIHRPPPVRRSELPSLAELLASTAKEFHDVSTMDRYYLGARVLVDMMTAGPPPYGRTSFAYVSLLGTGASPSQAWNKLFGSLERADIERAYFEHAERVHHIELHAPFTPPPLDPPTVRDLAEFEIHLVWAAIAESKEKLRGFIADAVRLAPDEPEVRYWGALLDGPALERIAHLRDAMAASPREERYALGLAMLLGADKPPPENAMQAALLDGAVHDLMRRARSPMALNAVAAYYAQRNDADVGLPFARRAAESDPNAEVLDTLATLLFEKGLLADAVVIAQRAVNVAADDQDMTPLYAHLAKFRGALQGTGAPVAAPADAE